MKAALRRSLPWQAAWLVPAVMVAVLYALGGTSPLGVTIGGVIGGFIGLFGALAAELMRSALDRRDQEAEVEQLARETLAERERRTTEFTAAQGARARELGFCCEAGMVAYPQPCPWHDEKRDEPPERG